jgi:putative endonuclease
MIEGQEYSAPFYLYNYMYVTYIIYSSKIEKFYTGQTSDLDRRMEEHNRGKTSFSASGMPWKLLYFRYFESRSEAIKLESFIKKRGAARFLADNNIQSG